MAHFPIVALHGFLGSKTDFSQLNLSHLYAPSLHAFACADFLSWAERFNRACPQKSILLGYSMGGRLALHCLLNNPHQFAAAIIIAAHPGLRTQALRETRYAHDYKWSSKFRSMPWDDLMIAWNQQDALSSSSVIVRNENDTSRTWLAQCLRYFSLGKQEDLSWQINQLDLPILWLSPQQESEKIASICLKNRHSEMLMFNQGGHRFMFSHAVQVSDTIRNFLAHLDRVTT